MTEPDLACTRYDVAREVKVSTAMVSRVVNGKDTVRPSTPQGVLEDTEELGYVSDGAARSLAQRPKEVIGLVAVESCAPPSMSSPRTSCSLKRYCAALGARWSISGGRC